MKSINTYVSWFKNLVTKQEVDGGSATVQSLWRFLHVFILRVFQVPTYSVELFQTQQVENQQFPDKKIERGWFGIQVLSNLR